MQPPLLPLKKMLLQDYGMHSPVIVSINLLLLSRLRRVFAAIISPSLWSQHPRLLLSVTSLTSILLFICLQELKHLKQISQSHISISSRLTSHTPHCSVPSCSIKEPQTSLCFWKTAFYFTECFFLKIHFIWVRICVLILKCLIFELPLLPICSHSKSSNTRPF